MQLARAAGEWLGQTVPDLVDAAIEAEHGRFALWLPVFMGAGVLAYYALRFEPPPWAGVTACGLTILLAVLLRGWPVPHGLATIAAAAALGFASGQFATARLPPPESGLPGHATIISGTVHAVETLPDGRRITIAHPRLDDAAEPLTRHLRVRLRANDHNDLSAGDTVRVRALVRPPAWPSYPGGWDLQRDAFYAGLGGSGYALGSAERVTQAVPGTVMGFVQWLREAIGRRVTAAIPGSAGAVAVTLLTGHAMAIPEQDHQAFRDSGLAHLLAVAGLHIGIVMGFTMGTARLALALSEHASLFWPTKKLAGAAALIAGGCYMVLTGMHVPIMRSFAMACLFTLALLAGRRAASIRGLGLAAVVLMLVAPQEVPGVSFQMSFSAVLALISGYEALRPWLRRLHGKSWGRRFVSHVVALALTSALAGTASMPYGAYHFGHIQVYYVIANMVAVPLTAILVMPLGMIALPLMLVGMEWLVLVPMGWGVEAILWVARTTAGWPAATFDVPHMPAWGLSVLSIGLAWLGIWRGPVRLAGLAAIALGIASPGFERTPDLLISADARLIGVRTTGGVFVQQTQGGTKFIRDAWVQYWSAGPAQPLPGAGTAAGGAVACVTGACLLRPRPDVRAALLVRGATKPEGCAESAVIVSAEPARGLCPRPWPKLVDRFTVWRDGAVAIWLEPDGARILTDRAERGTRPWVPPPPTPRPRPAPNLPPAIVDTAG